MSRLAILDRPPTGYHEDVAAWVEEQVALLRAGRLGDVDLANIVEEIEAVGSSQRSALNSQVARIVEHLLKLIYSPSRDSRRGWIETIRGARSDIEAILRASPSLRRAIDADWQFNLQRARRNAAAALKDFDELDRETESALLSHEFTPEQILGDWLPPRR